MYPPRPHSLVRLPKVVVVPTREILCPLTIGKSTHEYCGALVLRPGLPGLVQEDAIHRLAHKFGNGNALAACDSPQPASLLRSELNLRS